MDKTITQVVSLLQVPNIPDIKSVRFGKPLSYILEELPLIYVTPDTVNVKTRSAGANGIDEIDFSFTVNIITSPMLYWGDSNVKKFDEEWLLKTVGECSLVGTTYKYDTDTVLGIMRANHLLGGTTVGSMTCDISFKVGEEYIDEENSFDTREAVLRFSTKKIVSFG